MNITVGGVGGCLDAQEEAMYISGGEKIGWDGWMDEESEEGRTFGSHRRFGGSTRDMMPRRRRHLRPYLDLAQYQSRARYQGHESLTIVLPARRE